MTESTLESDIPISFLSNAAIYTSLFLFTILQEFHLVMLNLRISLMITQTSEEKREDCCKGEENAKKIEIGEVFSVTSTAYELLVLNPLFYLQSNAIVENCLINTSLVHMFRKENLRDEINRFQ